MAPTTKREGEIGGCERPLPFVGSYPPFFILRHTSMFKPSIEPNELSSFLSSPSPPPPTEEPHFNHSPINHLLGAGAPSRRMRRRLRRRCRRRRWRKEKNKKTDDVHPRLLFFLPPPTAGNPFFELLKTISYHRRGIRHLGSDGGGGEGRLALWHSSHYGGGEKGNRSYRRRYAFHTCAYGGAFWTMYANISKTSIWAMLLCA